MFLHVLILAGQITLKPYDILHWTVHLSWNIKRIFIGTFKLFKHVSRHELQRIQFSSQRRPDLLAITFEPLFCAFNLLQFWSNQILSGLCVLTNLISWSRLKYVLELAYSRSLFVFHCRCWPPSPVISRGHKVRQTAIILCLQSEISLMRPTAIMFLRSHSVPGWRLLRQWRTEVWPIATLQYTPRYKNKRFYRKNLWMQYFTFGWFRKFFSQRWAPTVDQLADSLDSPVIVLDSIPKTADVRTIEPKTR